MSDYYEDGWVEIPEREKKPKANHVSVSVKRSTREIINRIAESQRWTRPTVIDEAVTRLEKELYG